MTDQVNKPVAWLEPGTLNSADHDAFMEVSAKHPDDYADWFPVYTHPARGVVDEAVAVRAIEARNDYLRQFPGEAVPAMIAALQAAQPAVPSVPEGFVLVSRVKAGMAVTVANEWLDLFAETPGLEKYERYTYGPQVEMLRDDLMAALAATPKDQPAQGVDGG